MRLRFVLRALALAGFGIVGCQAIAGIEDRRYEPQEAGTSTSPLCRTYCTEVMQACTNQAAQYATEDTCLGICARLPEGDKDEPGGNTVACREAQARSALRGEEPETYCKSAGPGGETLCGDACESYCMLFDAVCRDTNVAAPLPNCVDLCNKLLVPGDLTNPAGSEQGDTLACRLYHVSAAAAADDPMDHCGHARLANPTANCIDMDQAADCDTYCKTVEATCGLPNEDGGTYAVYEDDAQCHAVCAALQLGMATDTTMNTVGCRTYHSYNAILLAMPELHCPHAGPGGDGHCGADNCESYCRLAEAACPTDFADHFGSGTDACMTECEKVPGAKMDSGYSVHAPDGNTVQCRLLHTARAFADQTECAAALGTTICQ